MTKLQPQWATASEAVRGAVRAGVAADEFAAALLTPRGRVRLAQRLGKRESEVLVWAFAAELVQLSLPVEQALALAEWGLTWQAIRPENARALSERVWVLASREDAHGDPAAFDAAVARAAQRVLGRPLFLDQDTSGWDESLRQAYTKAALLQQLAETFTQWRSAAPPEIQEIDYYDILAVSDFHLAAGNHPSPEGLAQFSPTEDFYFDDAFFRFLVHSDAERRERDGYPYELVFNGDMVDFAQLIVPEAGDNALEPWMLPLLDWDKAPVQPLVAELRATLETVYPVDSVAQALDKQRVTRVAALKAATAAQLSAIGAQAQGNQLEVKSPGGRGVEEAFGADAWLEEQWAAWADGKWEEWGEGTWEDGGGWDEVSAWSDVGAGLRPKSPVGRGVVALSVSPEYRQSWRQLALADLEKQARAAKPPAQRSVKAMQRRAALRQLADVYYGHPRFFQGLAWFLAQGNRLVLIRGNHDPQWYWPEVQQAFVGWLKTAYDVLRPVWSPERAYALPVPLKCDLDLQEAYPALPEVSLEEFAARVDFSHEWFYYRERLAYFEHGGQQEAVDAHRYFLAPVYDTSEPVAGETPEFVTAQEQELDPPVGSLGNVFLINLVESELPNFERPGYDKVYLPWLFYHAFGFSLKTLPLAAVKMLKSWANWARHFPTSRVQKRHEARLKAYAAQVNLSEACVEALDETRWVRRWRNWFASMFLFVLRVVLPFALPVVAVVGVAVWWRWVPQGGSESQTPLRVVLGGLFSVLSGAAAYWAQQLLTDWIGLGEDYLYTPARGVARTLAEHGASVPYLLFGHDHAHNAQKLPEGPWYLNTGTWMHMYGKERKRLFRTEHEYAFVRMVDTQQVLASRASDGSEREPAALPRVELLRWNDEAGRVETCEVFGMAETDEK